MVYIYLIINQMKHMITASFTDFFSTVDDHRVEGRAGHRMVDILAITFAAVMCGAEGWNEIELFGRSKEQWLGTFLELPNGIPSHDTFNRFFALMSPDSFERCFRQWADHLADTSEGRVVSIDGKTQRGSGGRDTSAVHMISAWVAANSTLLGQLRVDGKSNEITAIPGLLDSLMIRGAVVTIDAMGCQKDIAERIVAGGGHYVLAVKDNHPSLREDIEDSFRAIRPHDAVETLDFGHGRIEQRRCSVITDMGLVEDAGGWESLASIIRVESERSIKATGEVQASTRYYISSMTADATTFLSAIRAHWGIENGLHWSLDVAFNEDADRKRAGNAAQNFSLINRMALVILKNDSGTKASIKGKRLKAGWDHRYLRALLGF